LNGNLEEPTQRMFQYLLEDRCKQKENLVLDLGANYFYFTTYSAMMGCKVKSVEPQPRLIDIVKFTLSLNHVEDKVEFFNNAVNDDDSTKLKINYHNTCWACSYVSIAKPGDTNSTNQYIVSPIKVDDIIHENVLLMKIDVV